MTSVLKVRGNDFWVPAKVLAILLKYYSDKVVIMLSIQTTA